MINEMFKTRKISRIAQVPTDADNDEIKEKLKIKIREDAYLRIKKYVDLADNEVGGTLFGTVNYEKGIIQIESVDLPPQTVSSASVEYDTANILSPEQISKALTLRKDSNGVAQGTKMLGTWHSHVNMGAFASPVDEGCAKNFLATPPMILNTLFVSLIFNKSGDVLVRVDFVADKNTIVYVEDLELIVDDNGKSNRLNNAFKKHVLSNISKVFKDEYKLEEFKEKLEEVFKEVKGEEELDIPESIEKECEELYEKNVKTIQEKVTSSVYADFNSYYANKDNKSNLNKIKDWIKTSKGSFLEDELSNDYEYMSVSQKRARLRELERVVSQVHNKKSRKKMRREIRKLKDDIYENEVMYG